MVTLLLLWADYSGLGEMSGMTKLPWAGDIYTEKEGSPLHLMPVLLYCVLLPVLFAVSLRGLLRMVKDEVPLVQYLRTVYTPGMMISVYIIVIFIWQSAAGAALLNDHEQKREKLRQSAERDLLLLELNEVCFLAREKMLLPDSLGGIGKQPVLYKARETELLRKIVGGSQFAALEKIMISGLTDSTIAITAISRGDRFTFDATVYITNRQVIYEQLSVSGEQK